MANRKKPLEILRGMKLEDLSVENVLKRFEAAGPEILNDQQLRANYVDLRRLAERKAEGDSNDLLPPGKGGVIHTRDYSAPGEIKKPLSQELPTDPVNKSNPELLQNPPIKTYNEQNFKTFNIQTNMKDRLVALRIAWKKARQEKLTAAEELYILHASELFVNMPEVLAFNGKSSAIPLLITRSAITGATMGGSESNAIRNVEDFAPALKELGVEIIPSTAPIKDFPVPTGNSSGFVSETEEMTESTDTIEKVSLAALRVSYSIPVSKLLLGQGSPDVLDRLTGNIITNCLNKVLATAFGTGARTAKRGQGAGYAITTGTNTKSNAVVPSFATLLAMEKELSDASVPLQKMAYLVNHAGRNILKGILREAGAGGKYLMGDDNRVNGWPGVVCNAVSNAAGEDGMGNLLIFGPWQSLLLVQFGGFLLEVDPYTNAKKHEAVVSVSGFFDWKSEFGTSSTGLGTDVNEWKYFATRAIKPA